MKPWVCPLGISALLIAAVGYRAASAHEAEDSKQPLVVGISSVEEGGSRTSVFSKFSNAVPHFDVVLRNASDKPLKLWAEDCSPGNGTLRLEISAVDSKPLSQPILVTRHTIDWSTNYIRGVTLGPGDVSVREVHLYLYQPGERRNPQADTGNREDYLGFPTITSNSTFHTYRMRAVFEITPSEWGTHEGIWTGRAVSETRDYKVYGFYP